MVEPRDVAPVLPRVVVLAPDVPLLPVVLVPAAPAADVMVSAVDRPVVVVPQSDAVLMLFPAAGRIFITKPAHHFIAGLFKDTAFFLPVIIAGIAAVESLTAGAAMAAGGIGCRGPVALRSRTPRSVVFRPVVGTIGPTCAHASFVVPR